jgi:hypothetical protein
MVLVTASWRGRRVANALMTRCIEAADARNLQAWLDATPAGAAVYRPMGFTDTGLSLARLRRTGAKASSTPNRANLDKDLQKLLDADRRAMGFDRSELIRHFAARADSTICETGDAIGLVRAGRKARQIGPVYAKSETATIALLDRVLAENVGSLIIDLSVLHGEARDFLLSCGFVFERPFSRMRFGAGTPKATGGSTEVIAVAGPDFG